MALLTSQIFADSELQPSANIIDFYTVNDAITYAINNNLDVEQSKLQIEKSKYQIQSAVSMILPTIKLDALGGKLDYYTNRISFPGAPSETNYYQAKLSFNQLLFGTYILPTLDIANLSYKASLDQLDATKDLIAYQVNQLYYTILRTANLKKIAEDSIQRNSDHLKTAEALFRIGITTKANVLQTEARLKDTEQKLTEADKFLKIAKVNFNLVLNRDLKKPFNLDDSDFSKIATKNLENTSIDKLDIYINKAIQRPNIQILYKSKEILGKTISIQQSNYYPSLFATGYYGFIDTNGFTTNRDNRDWLVAAGLSWTLFDGLGTSAKVSMAQNDYQRMEKTVDQTEKFVYQEILDALLSINLAKQNMETSKVQIKFASESYKLFREQFKAGLSTNQELLDAEYALSLAQINYIDAIFDLILARKKLEYLTNEI